LPNILISIVPPSLNPPALTSEQTRNLLYFIFVSLGANKFTVNFVYVEDEEELVVSFYERLSSFAAGKEVLEKIQGDGFGEQRCWTLNDASIESILKECHGDILSYDVCNLPEDWLFFAGDEIILQTVTHEREAILRLSEAQYADFRNLEIQHKIGLAQWTVLPELPLRPIG
jgi:hypothetical protein